MVWFILDEIESIKRFLGLGGDVLVAIFALTVLLWTLILERYFFFAMSFPAQAKCILLQWSERVEAAAWNNQQVRRALISQASISAHQSLPLIKTLIALCPLLGLLGTVVGMVQVFDVLAVTGTGSPRAMASGISKATIPTMAGMMAALSGIYFAVQLEKRAQKVTRELTDKLQHH
ncbi:MotA/TolQ/ExbB proton channel family protein [Hahella sp. HN01]|uniref:MotA/TolQ/ExbB proton channel family protein n=1 Tax=Hahella sp. HN01 TaxID=2847262 RepID=UPI001C1EC931|nr:MotA/TolQ/ExbB proton channel family protein [Hahella sp. HN01]MBU6953108.1 MotA/TolQ/ExbB proton channel family protein [Hahella sp. HN01]